MPVLPATGSDPRGSALIKRQVAEALHLLAVIEDKAMNIVEPIPFQARYQLEAPALCARGIDVISYARLTGLMNNVARRATASGLSRGQVAALSIEHPLLHALDILGLAQAGIVTVSVWMHAPPSGLRIDAVIQQKNIPSHPECCIFP